MKTTDCTHLKVGDEVIVKRRIGKGESTSIAKVAKVGNKYFLIDTNQGNKFHRANGIEVSEFKPAKIYLSALALAEEIEFDYLHEYIRKAFSEGYASNCPYTLQQLRDITNIIKPK